MCNSSNQNVINNLNGKIIGTTKKKKETIKTTGKYGKKP
jgi:hypothetical protein